MNSTFILHFLTTHNIHQIMRYRPFLRLNINYVIILKIFLLIFKFKIDMMPYIRLCIPKLRLNLKARIITNKCYILL